MGIKKRDWSSTDSGTIVCFNSKKSTCVVFPDKAPLATVAELTPSHDEDLARATDEINKILTEVIAKKRYDRKHAGFLLTHKGPLLAWMEFGVTADDEDEEIEKALRLSAEC